MLKNQANFAVSSTQLSHSWFDYYKSLFCMEEIFLKRIFCLFKKVSHDKEHQPRSAVRIGLINGHARGVRLLRERGFV